MGIQPSPSDKHVLKHLPALDGLRGLAILLVILCHSNIVSPGKFGNGAGGHTYHLVAGAGWIGVDLFFVLSGFLITRILLQSRDYPHYFRNFYARRFLRISPLYYAYALGCFLIVPLFLPHIYSKADYAAILLYYYNFWSVKAGPVYYFGALWSLSVEEHFYLVWPFIVRICTLSTLKKLSILGMIASLAARIILIRFVPHIFHTPTIAAVYLLTPCRLDGLCAGAWLAIQEYENTSWSTLEDLALPVFGASLLLLSAIAWRTGHFYDFMVTPDGALHTSALIVTFGLSLLAILFSAVLVLCLSPGLVNRIFRTSALRTIGKYSYGMYIFHGLVMIGLHQVLHRFYPYIGLVPGKILFAILGTIATFGVAFVSYRLLEKPFLNMKRHFPNKQGQPTHPHV